MDDYEMELDSVGSENRDRLSELPDSLIHVILSFVPMRDVVCTTFLSKRWNKLWMTVPCFNFHERIFEGDEMDRVRNFVNRVLLLRKGTKLLKFEFTVENDFDRSLAGDVDLWVRFAVENEVEELKIHLMNIDMEMGWKDPIVDSKRDAYWVPQCLNSCSSIRKLSLEGCNLPIDASPLWNQLKSLKIDGFCLSESLVNRILLGSPQLEVFDLRLLESYENLNIQSSSLKELKIEKHIYSKSYRGNDTMDTVLRVCCPKLEILNVSGALYTKCFLNVPSLNDVTFGFYPYFCRRNGVPCEDELLGETWRQFFSTIQHVEKLTLYVRCQMLEELKQFLSPLPNVKFLKLDAGNDDLSAMVDLFGIFPNIKMLVIRDISFETMLQDYVEVETNISKSLLLQLKTVQITSSFEQPYVLQFIEFFLKHCSMLEKLEIRATRIGSYRHAHARMFNVAERLLSMPRISPTARLIFNPKTVFEIYSDAMSRELQRLQHIIEGLQSLV